MLSVKSCNALSHLIFIHIFCFCRSTGFVLEGFPRNADEADYMAMNGFFPDLAILLQVDDNDVIGRLLPPKMDKWREKRDKKLARRQKIKEKAKKKRVSNLFIMLK